MKRRRATPFPPDQEPAARALLAELLERVRAGEDTRNDNAQMTVAAWSTRWNELRREAGKREHVNEAAHLEHHIVPLLGRYRLEAVTGRHTLDFVRKLAGRKSTRTGEELAPATVRKIAGTLHAMLKEAAKRGILPANPCAWDAEDLPDAEAARVGEGFTEDEVAQLLWDERVPRDRRMLYALEFLTGMRTGEAAARRWRDLDRTRKPLAALRVESAWNSRHKVEKETKTKVRRVIPVHPDLGELLAGWWEEGWQAFVGRPPTEDDLIVPEPDGQHRSTASSWARWQADLEVLHLAAQRHYETRSTFINLAEGGGAEAATVGILTHPSPKAAKDLYRRQRLLWPKLCEAVCYIQLRAQK